MNGNKVNRLIKVLTVALLIAMLACACLLVAACKHEHDYELEMTVEPTCNTVGKMTYKCTKCDNSYSVELPMTEHSYVYRSNGDKHWQVCTVCSAETARVAHEYTEVKSSAPATCQATGLAIKACVCGNTTNEVLPIARHSFTVTMSSVTEHWLKCANCSETSDAEPHKFEAGKVIELSTCTTHGSQELSCSCGQTKTEALPLIEHTMVELIPCPDGHEQCAATCCKTGHADEKCSECGWTRCVSIPMTNDHNFGTEWENNGTFHWHACSNSNGDGQCTARGDEAQHNYVTKRIEPTCTGDGQEWRECEQCGYEQDGSNKTLPKTGHDIVYYPKKAATEDEAGCVNHWQCLVCQKYFSSKNCEVELTEDQVFIYPPAVIKRDGIAQLLETGKQLPDSIESDDYYQITATVGDVEKGSRALLLGDGTEVIYVTLIERENIQTIKANDVITLKGKLFRLGNDVTLVNCKAISVDCGDNELHSLYLTGINYPNDGSIYMEITSDISDDEYYSLNTNNYNCIMAGVTLTFGCNKYNYSSSITLQKVIINGKPYTTSNGVIEIVVGDEDIYAEFVFGDSNLCSVTMYHIDTNNNNGNAIDVDGYISYTYVGGYNKYGRLYKDSHLTFYSDNANISKIDITYDVDWLDEETKKVVLENVAKVIKDNGVKVDCNMSELSGRGQVTITVPVDVACTVLDYFVKGGQTRIDKITVYYQTSNSFTTSQ